MRAKCPKCGAERVGESCPRCGLVFARFDPGVLDEHTPEPLKDLWRYVSDHWEDAAAHDHFIEQALAASRGDYAARCYRQRAGDPTADERLEKIREQLDKVAVGLAAIMAGNKSEVRPRERTPLATVLVLLAFLLALAGLSMIFLKVLK